MKVSINELKNLIREIIDNEQRERFTQRVLKNFPLNWELDYADDSPGFYRWVAQLGNNYKFVLVWEALDPDPWVLYVIDNKHPKENPRQIVGYRLEDIPQQIDIEYYKNM